MSSIKQKILDGIQTAKEKLGITLIYEEWGSKQQKCACALGCVLLANDHGLCDDAEQNATEAADILGVSEGWINNFIRGFDGDSPDGDDPKEAWEIGSSLRDETLPVNHTDYLNGLEDFAVEFQQSIE
jgi:hypothetical protein